MDKYSGGSRSDNQISDEPFVRREITQLPTTTMKEHKHRKGVFGIGQQDPYLDTR